MVHRPQLLVLLLVMALAGSACGDTSTSQRAELAENPAQTPTATAEPIAQDAAQNEEQLPSDDSDVAGDPESPGQITLPTPDPDQDGEGRIVVVAPEGPDVAPHVSLIEPLRQETVEEDNHMFLHVLDIFGPKHGGTHEVLYDLGYSHEDIHGTLEIVQTPGMLDATDVDVGAYCPALFDVLDRGSGDPRTKLEFAARALAALAFAPSEHQQLLIDVVEDNSAADESDQAARIDYRQLRLLVIYGLNECDFELPNVRLGPSGDNLIFSVAFGEGDPSDIDSVGDAVTDEPVEDE